ncbi:hypothetical protein Pint_23825 [Pistacia integerrima]|uniref:Uncharacterized protein n=1 Tax=Pistacia integerrima TaxID=434235 RepID=A0ACC0YNZ0_9ROSI|nr:hypothetical protein Pint_23825 [Pistacia integerrima]
MVCKNVGDKIDERKPSRLPTKGGDETWGLSKPNYPRPDSCQAPQGRGRQDDHDDKGVIEFGWERVSHRAPEVEEVPKSHIDDEYANATERDPKFLLPTSLNPSAPLAQFVKELKFVFPNAQRMNRGSQVISEIIETCRAHEFTDVVLVHEHRGLPDGLIISHLPFGPTAYFGLLNVASILSQLGK